MHVLMNYLRHIELLEDIGHVGKISVSGYSDQRFKSRLHQYVVSLSKTLNPHCLSCEMSTKWEHPREGCLFSVICFQGKIVVKNKNKTIFYFKFSLFLQVFFICHFS